MAWELVVLATGERFPLEVGKEYAVGTSAVAHVRLAARDVSAHHALLCVHPDHIRVVDLGSKNGTFHKGKRVAAAQVFPGEMLRFSSVQVQFFLAQEPPTPPSPGFFQEKPASQTAEFPAVTVEEALVELIRAFDLAPQQAVESLLTWLVSRRRLTGCALLEKREHQVLVLGAQGSIPEPALAAPLLEAAWPAGEKEGQALVELPLQEGRAFLAALGEGLGLVLVPGNANPSAQEVTLYGQLARTALRLAGSLRG